jgi:uncharacterized protein (TIGR03382 family)
MKLQTPIAIAGAGLLVAIGADADAQPIGTSLQSLYDAIVRGNLIIAGNASDECDPADSGCIDDGLCDGPQDVDGVCVAGEDLDADGIVDAGETDPNDPSADVPVERYRYSGGKAFGCATSAGGAGNALGLLLLVGLSLGLRRRKALRS